MRKRFVFAREDAPGDAWRRALRRGATRPSAGIARPGRAAPAAAQCRAALREHMPELLPHYDRACALVGDDELAHASSATIGRRR